MRIVERFTRDRASRFIWGGLTLACALGLVFALQGEQRALDDEISAANTRTARYANTVVYDIATSPTLSSTEVEFRFRDMLVAAQAEVFTDPTVARMRLWDLDGVLRFSTDQPRGSIGAVQVEDERVVAASREGSSSFTQTTEPFTPATTGRDGEPTRLLQTFVPLTVPDRIDPLGAVQIDYLYDRLVENARDPWLQFQVLFAGLLGLFALLTVLSLRRPLTRTERVPVAALPAPAPATEEVSAQDADEGAAALQEELVVAREQLTQAEEAYRYLEVRLKKTQEDLARSGGEPSPEIEHQITAAERDRVMAESRADLAEQKLAEMQQRLERLSRDPTAPPPVVSEAAPVGPKDSPPADAEPAPEPSEAAEPAPTEPADAPAAREPQPVGAKAEGSEEAAASDAASELRARLARTAARKKLGPNVTE